MLSPLRPTDLRRGKTTVPQLSCRGTLPRLSVQRKGDVNAREDVWQQLDRNRFHTLSNAASPHTFSRHNVSLQVIYLELATDWERATATRS